MHCTAPVDIAALVQQAQHQAQQQQPKVQLAAGGPARPAMDPRALLQALQEAKQPAPPPGQKHPGMEQPAGQDAAALLERLQAFQHPQVRLQHCCIGTALHAQRATLRCAGQVQLFSSHASWLILH